MRVLANGNYELDDGSIVPASEVGKIFEKKKKNPKENDCLQEGHCSDPILLED